MTASLDCWPHFGLHDLDGLVDVLACSFELGELRCWMVKDAVGVHARRVNVRDRDSRALHEREHLFRGLPTCVVFHDLRPIGPYL